MMYPAGRLENVSSESWSSSSIRREIETDSLALWKRAIAADDLPALQRQLDQAHDSASARALITQRAGNGKSALMVAAKLGDGAAVDYLLRLGARVDERTNTDGTSFMFAVLGDHRLVAEQLIERGADADAVGSNGWSALMIAAARGRHEMVEWLVGQKVTVDRADVYRLTPLMRAVDNGHYEAARVLLEAGLADADHQDESGSTALHYAVSAGRKDLVRLLVRHQARPDIENRDGITPAALSDGSPGLQRLLR